MKTPTSAPKPRQILLAAVGLEIEQSPVSGALYLFAIDGKTIAKQLGVRRMKWHRGKLQGFQRQIDKNRVATIADYLTNNHILPNALVVAFVRGALSFKPLPNQTSGQPRLGSIELTGKLEETDEGLQAVKEEERIGYVIDGQHRLKAIEASALQENDFPVVMVAFHGVDTRFQLDQFYALNQTVPINTGHLALLRRQLGYVLPPKEASKKAISDIAGIIQEFDKSPFQAERHIGSKVYPGPLSVTVLEGMIGRAVKLTNLKFHWKQNAADIPAKDLQYIAKCLYIYWRAISEVFSDFWGRKPKDQRLFSAMGLYTLFLFYDRVMEGIDPASPQAINQVKKELSPIADLKWDKQMLSIPSTPKSTFRPEHLFDAINELWQANGKRPFTLKIKDPAAAGELVHLDLT